MTTTTGQLTRLGFILALLRTAGSTYWRAEALVHARAIAYAALFAVVPLIVLAISFLGALLRRQEVTWYFEQTLPGTVSTAFAQLSNQAATTSPLPRAGLAVNLVAAFFALWGASTLLMQLRTSLNRMFNLARREQPAQRGALDYLVRRGLSLLFAVLLGAAFVLINAVTFVASSLGASLLAAGLRGGWLGGLIGSLFVNVMLFALVYRLLPQGDVHWRDLLPGACLTALLFWLGNIGVGIYFYFAQGMLRFGAAGTVLVVLLWLFVVALIVLFGAKFTDVYARMRGRPVVPDAGMFAVEHDAFFQT